MLTAIKIIFLKAPFTLSRFCRSEPLALHNGYATAFFCRFGDGFWRQKGFYGGLHGFYGSLGGFYGSLGGFYGSLEVSRRVVGVTRWLPGVIRRLPRVTHRLLPASA